MQVKSQSIMALLLLSLVIVILCAGFDSNGGSGEESNEGVSESDEEFTKVWSTEEGSTSDLELESNGAGGYRLYQTESDEKKLKSQYTLTVVNSKLTKIEVSSGTQVLIPSGYENVSEAAQKKNGNPEGAGCTISGEGIELRFLGDVTLGWAAFNGQDALKGISFDGNVTFNKWTFLKCSNLEYIMQTNPQKKVDVADSNAIQVFRNCSKVSQIEFYGNVDLKDDFFSNFNNKAKTIDTEIILHGNTQITESQSLEGYSKGRISFQIYDEASLPIIFGKNVAYVLQDGATLNLLGSNLNTNGTTEIQIKGDQCEINKPSGIQDGESVPEAPLTIKMPFGYCGDASKENAVLYYDSNGKEYPIFKSYAVKYLNGDKEVDVIYKGSNGTPTLNSDETLYKYLDENSTSFTVPSSVKYISNEAFKGNAKLTGITFAEGLMTVGESAFEDCTALESINFPNSLTNISNSAFYGCTALATVHYGTALTTIGNNAFYGCTALSLVDFPASLKSIGVAAFSGCEALSSVVFQNGTGSKTIGDMAFYRCLGLSSISFGDGVSSIGVNAFAMVVNKEVDNKNTISNLTLPKSLKSIGSGAFNNWRHLDTVTFSFGDGETGLETLAGDAFKGCEKLETINIPTCSLTSVGVGFPGTGCSSELKLVQEGNDGGKYKILNGVLYEKSGNGTWRPISAGKALDLSSEDITSISQNAYAGYKDLEEVILPTSIAEIGDGAFSGCVKLKKVTIISTQGHAGIKIGKEAFNGCISLQSIKYSDGSDVPLTGLAEGSFKNCKALSSAIKLSSEIGEIPASCFEGCGLTTIDGFGSSSVNSIGKDAFKDSGLTSISLPDGMQTIGETAFSGSKISTIELPSATTLGLGSGSIIIGGKEYQKMSSPFTGCQNLTSIKVRSGSQYVADGDCLMDKDGNILVVPGGLETVKIPNSAKAFLGTIKKGDNDVALAAFFADNVKMKIIDLSESSITEIPDGLFYNRTELVSVTLSQNIVSIGRYAFTYAEKLSEVKFNSNDKLISIGEMAFSQTGLTQIVIPSADSSSGGTIGKKAFYGSQNLAKVTVGSGWKIGEESFGEIRSAVRIVFEASPAEIDDSAFYGSLSLEAIQIKGESTSKYSTDPDNTMLFENLEDGKKRLILVTSSVGSVTLPADVICFSKNAFNNNLALKAIHVDSENEVFQEAEGSDESEAMLLEKDADGKAILVCVPRGMSRVIVPEGVAKISPDAFSGKQYVSELVWGGGSTTADIDFEIDSIVNASVSSLIIQTSGKITICGASSTLDVPKMKFIGESVSVKETERNKVRFSTSIESLTISDGTFNLNDRLPTYTVRDGANVALQYVLFDVTLGSKTYTPAEAVGLLTGYNVTFAGDLQVIPDLYSVSLEWTDGTTQNPAVLRFSATTDSGHIPGNMVLKVGDDEIGFKDGMYTVELNAGTTLTFSERSGVTKHTVTFVYGHDITDATVEILDGQAVPSATIADKTGSAKLTGYGLYGWYTDGQYKTQYSSGAIKEDTSLYAKWALDEGIEVVFDSSIRAKTADGYLFSGEKVEKGSVVSFVFSGSGSELKDWIVNGRAVGSSANTIERTVQSRTEVQADTRTVSAYGDGLTEIDAPFEDIKQLWAFKNDVDTSMSIWSGFPTVPLVVDDSVYFRAGDTLYRVDSFTKDVVKSVYTEDSTIVAYYIYIGYGDGTILDYATGRAYDLELNYLWKMPTGTVSAFYGENGYFYGICDGKLSKFSSEDGSVAEGWSVDVSGWHAIYGTTSKPVVLDGKAYYVNISGNDRGIGCVDLETGESDEITLQYAKGMLLDDGWLTTAKVGDDDYLFLTAYGKGLFDQEETKEEGSSKNEGSRLFSVKLNEDGSFADDCERFMQFSAKSSGCASAFIVFNGRGYVNINGTETGSWGTLYTIDVDKFIDGVYGDDWLAKYYNSSKGCYADFVLCKQDSTYTHGSIVVNTAQYESTGSVYIYMLPYNPCGTMILVFEDHEGKVRDTGHTEIKGSNAYGSQTVRIGANGVLVWYDDSGTVYCYASASKVPYRFLFQDGDGAEWVSQQGTDAEDALKKALEAKGWDSDISKLNIWFKNEGDYYKATDLTDKTVSGFREFLVSTDITDINKIPERTFYLYRTDGAAESYSILTLFDDHTVKGKLSTSMDSKFLIHNETTAEWISVSATGDLNEQVKKALDEAGVDYGTGLTANVFIKNGESWESISLSESMSGGHQYLISLTIDDVSKLPSDSYYILSDGKILIKTLEDLMEDCSLSGKYTTTPIYTVEYQLNGGTASANFAAEEAVVSGGKFEVPDLGTINAKITRNNYVIQALLLDGKDVSGKTIAVTGDTVIEISWAWKDESKRVADVGLSSTDGSTYQIIYDGSGYGATKAGAQKGINNFYSDFNKDDVADQTMFVVVSQSGSPKGEIIGNLYRDGNLIYSEDLNGIEHVWYVTIGPGQNSNTKYGQNGVLQSVVGDSTSFVMEIEIGGTTAVRAVINLPQEADAEAVSGDSASWVAGTPEIRRYYQYAEGGAIKEGSTLELKPVFYVEDGNGIKVGEVAQKKVYWTSSDESVAKVSDGKVIAVSKGTAVITCITEDGGHRFSCAVKVSPTAISGAKIGWADGESRGLNPGQTGQLAITCETGAASKIAWSSSDESVIYIDSSGNVKAISCGKAVITAVVTDNAGSDPVTVKMDIEVSNRLVESIELEEQSITLNPGDNTTLKASVGPEDATDRTYTWKVSKGSSVTVDRDGTVTAVSVGESTVRVTANDGSGIFAECVVTVDPVKVTAITLSDSAMNLEINGKAQLKATVGPTNATDKSLVWSVSGSCVTVDQSGNVSAVSEGKATITVAAADGSGQKATCVVTVIDYAVKSIDMSSSIKLEVGKTSTLTATVSPSYAKNKTITWSSSNPAVATVASGVVTALSAGTAVITATSAGTSGITATCVVTVTDSVSKVQSVSIDSSSLSLDVGSKATVKATVSPEVSGVEYVWSVGEGTGSVSIQKNSDGSAVVTANTAGTVSLVVTVKGTEVSATCEITIVSKETKKVSEDTKTNDDGTSTTTTVEEIDTGKGSSTTKTTEVVKDSAGNVQGTETVYEFKSDDSSIKTVTTVTIAKDGDGNAGDPKVAVDMGTKGSASNGTRSITVNSDQLKEALRQIECAKAVTGIEDLDKKIEIRADEGKDVDAMTTTLDAASISSLSASDGASLSISSEMGRMEIGTDVFSTMESMGGKATISVKKADDTATVPETISEIGQKSIFEVELVVGGKSVHDLNGSVTLSLPFALSDGQDPKKVGVRYVDSDGNLSSEVFRASYADGMVSFTTTHFSTFAVVYGDVATDSDDGKTTTVTSGGDSTMTALCIVLAALTGAFAATTVMFILRGKGRI